MDIEDIAIGVSVKNTTGGTFLLSCPAKQVSRKAWSRLQALCYTSLEGSPPENNALRK